ncbi:DUF2515 family protein [Paenibacillus ihbetae]
MTNRLTAGENGMQQGGKDKQAWAGSLRRWVSTLAEAAAEALSGRVTSWEISSNLREGRKHWSWDAVAARSLRSELKRIVRRQHKELKMNVSPPAMSLPFIRAVNTAEGLHAREQEVVESIQSTVQEANQSNITRTEAYLSCYEAFPELHWAFLAHMVSRNAGWNMSDLQGGLLSDLTDSEFQVNLYRFLERCNALIFQDAYPQLLLYMHSRKLGEPLFHLLPCFHVSAFMLPFWQHFWREPDHGAMLAVALILNEQNYIEGRVAQDPYFRSRVLKHPYFRLHELARFNQILFPLGQTEAVTRSVDPFGTSHKLPLRPLAGLTIPRFDSLTARIKAGKSLYGLLFGYEEVHRRALAFARSTPHRGSRSEYWPALFTADKQEAINSGKESSVLMESEWLPSGNRLYSPALESVWQDTPAGPIPRYDWYRSSAKLRHFREPDRPLLLDMTHAHRAQLEKTAMAHDVSHMKQARP